MHFLHTNADIADGSSLPAQETDHADQSHANDSAVSRGHQCVSSVSQEGDGSGMLGRARTAFRYLVDL